MDPLEAAPAEAWVRNREESFVVAAAAGVTDPVAVSWGNNSSATQVGWGTASRRSAEA